MIPDRRSPSPIAAALERYHETNPGPIAMRTADTPWQTANRPKRRRQRQRTQAAQRRVRRAEAGMSPIQRALAPEREPEVWNFRVPVEHSLGPIDMDFDFPLSDAALNFFENTVPNAAQGVAGGLMDIAGFASGDDRVIDRRVESSGIGPGSDLERQLEGGSESILGLPGLAASQIAGSFAYTPAFIAQAVVDPGETAKGLANYAKFIIEDPARFVVERPGDTIMLAAGLKGLVSGRVPNVAGALAKGDVRAAARAAVSQADSTGALTRGTPLEGVRADSVIPGAKPRTMSRERELLARTRSADAAGLVAIARKVTFDAPKDVGKRRGVIAQSEAIRAVLDGTMPAERISFYRYALERAKTPSAKYRLRKLIDANELVERLNLVDGAPGAVRIADNQVKLAALTERIVESSERGQANKVSLGLLNPETAQARLSSPGIAIRRSGIAEGTPEHAPPGRAYGSYKVEDLAPRLLLGPRIRDRLGLPKKPVSREFTGRALEQGRVGNIIKLTAQEELSTLRYQGRLEGWRDAVKASIPASELIRRVEQETKLGLSPEDILADYAAVRVKAGNSLPSTKDAYGLFDRVQIDSARSLLDVRSSRPLELNDLRAIAAEADLAGQVRFFRITDVGLDPLIMKRPNAAVAAARFVNQMAKFSLLFLAGPAYALGNLIGQEAFSVLHKGVKQPLSDFWQAPRLLRNLGPTTRNQIRAIGGTGMNRAIQYGSGPSAKFRKLNNIMGDFYSRFLDDFWRDGAFVYEAKRLGYDTPAKIQKLFEEYLKGDRESRAYQDMMRIKYGIDEHFGAFDRLTPFEKNTVTDLVFWYPWIRASAVYAAKLPLHHPVKTAALTVGGTVANARAEADFTEAFISHGVPPKQAREMAKELMRMMPGLFMVGDKTVNPLSVALLSSPEEIKTLLTPLLQGDFQGALEAFMSNVPPAAQLVGAAVGINTMTGSPFYSGDPVSRVADAIPNFNRDVTLYRRLKGDQGVMFTYSPKEAVAQRTIGSVAPRTPNWDGIIEVMNRRFAENAPKETPLERRASSLTEQNARLVEQSQTRQALLDRLVQRGEIPEAAAERFKAAILLYQRFQEIEDRFAYGTTPNANLTVAKEKDRLAAVRNVMVTLVPQHKAEIDKAVAAATELEEIKDLRAALQEGALEISGWYDLNKLLEAGVAD